MALILRGLIGGLFQVGLVGAALLIPAGSWDWPRATQFLVVYAVVNSISIVALARYSPDSLEARLEAPASATQPLADRIITPLFILSLLGWLAFIPIDVFRLQLLPPPRVGVCTLGAVIGVIGYAFIWTTLFQNAFAAPIVRDQSERGQVLIDSGLYGRIRHPFYAGLFLFFLGLALWLQSYAAVLLLLVPGVLIIARILVEERTLDESLAGYAEYRTKVPYRLLPYVW